MRQTDTIYGRFADQVVRQPDACAVKESGVAYSFARLDEMACVIAAALPPDQDAIGIVMDHGAWQIASILAILRCGAAYVPIEPDFPIERTHTMLKESKATYVITDRSYVSRLDGFAPLFVDTLSASMDVSSAALLANCPKPKAVAPNAPAYILYTSGTTGIPKGVVVDQHNVCHYADAFHHEFHNGPDDIMLQYSVCSFDIFVEEVFASLLNGSAIAIPSTEVRGDLAALLQFVKDEQLTIISGFPYLLADINDHGVLPSCVRLLISGGDVLRERYIDRLIDHTTIYNTYGPSETTVCCTYCCCNTTPALEDGTYPIGKAVQGSTVRIMDEDLHPVATGEVGEICISGDGVTQGYVRVSNNAPFVTDADGHCWYKSGDMGYELPDGSLAFMHRKDSQVMILGKRVEAHEVEAVLNRCDGVRAGVVRADTDDQGLSYLTAYVVAQPSGFKLAQVKRQMARYLAPFMIPEYFVLLDTLPRNMNGKPDTKALPTVLKVGNY